MPHISTIQHEGDTPAPKQTLLVGYLVQDAACLRDQPGCRGRCLTSNPRSQAVRNFRDARDKKETNTPAKEYDKNEMEIAHTHIVLVID